MRASWKSSSKNNNNTPAMDAYSVWKFRLWRSLNLVFHVAFVYHALQALNLGHRGFFVRFVSALTVSAVAFHFNYALARFLCVRRAEMQPLRTAIFVITVGTLRGMAIEESNTEVNAVAIFSFLTMSFMAYVRSIVGDDDSGMLVIIMLSSASFGRAAIVYSFGWNGCLYFTATCLLGILSLYVGRGFMAPDAGLFDRFLDIFG